MIYARINFFTHSLPLPLPPPFPHLSLSLFLLLLLLLLLLLNPLLHPDLDDHLLPSLVHVHDDEQEVPEDNQLKTRTPGTIYWRKIIAEVKDNSKKSNELEIYFGVRLVKHSMEFQRSPILIKVTEKR